MRPLLRAGAGEGRTPQDQTEKRTPVDRGGERLQLRIHVSDHLRLEIHPAPLLRPVADQQLPCRFIPSPSVIRP